MPHNKNVKFTCERLKWFNKIKLLKLPGHLSWYSEVVHINGEWVCVCVRSETQKLIEKSGQFTSNLYGQLHNVYEYLPHETYAIPEVLTK